MAKIWVDGKEIEIKKDETILQACLRENVYIPYFCYHPSLSVVGQCRMCLVKVEGMPKLITACTTTVLELPPEKKIDGKYDLKVYINCEEVKEAQKGVLEFLLLNHPLDCPICDQAGECQLQNYSYNYGSARSEFKFEKLHYPKRVDLGPHIVYDAERCIKCTRCIRFCNEITKTGELTLVERGVNTYVDTFEGRKLDNDYSVCTADICPVGALTYKEFRFKERVWFLQASNSVCPECGRNCSIRVDSYKGEILRIVPRFNPRVNNYFMCDYGRLISERIKDKEVKELPSERIDGELVAKSEEDFYQSLLSTIIRNYERKDIFVVLSGRMTNEEFQAYKIFSLLAFGEIVGEVLYVTGKSDAILINEEKRPNYEGARYLGLNLTIANENLSNKVKNKKLLVVFRENLIKDGFLTEEAIKGVENVVVFDSFFNETAKFANYYIPLANWFEMEGTTINVNGYIQKLSKCVTPPRGRKPFYEVVTLILNKLKEMDKSQFKSKKVSEIETLKNVLLGFEKREVFKKGFIPWFSEVKNAIRELKDIEFKELLPFGFSIKDRKNGNG